MKKKNIYTIKLTTIVISVLTLSLLVVGKYAIDKTSDFDRMSVSNEKLVQLSKQIDYYDSLYESCSKRAKLLKPRAEAYDEHFEIVREYKNVIVSYENNQLVTRELN